MTSLPCTAPAAADLPRHDAFLDAVRPDLGGMRRSWRDALFAAALTLPAAMILHADEAPQGWVPDVLSFPADMEVLSDRAIGTTIRMFSFATARDVEALLAEWEIALSEGGYAILQTQDDILDSAIEFSGTGIVNAKIVIAPVTDGDRNIIEVDATLQ